MRSSRKGASAGVTKKKPGGLTRGTPKERMRPVSENKVISLSKRAEDEEKPFFAPGRSAQAAIENEVIDAHLIPQGST